MQTYQLSDGRALTYEDFGDLAGRPVFYCHGTPSSRLEGALLDEPCRRLSLHLIAVDRPGMGGSSPQSERQILDWPHDIAALADALGYARFGIAGHSGGGPYVMACAGVLAEHLDFALAFCPFGPPTLNGKMIGLNPVDQFYAGLGQRWPGLMEACFAPLGWCAKVWPSLFDQIFKAGLSPADRAIYQDQSFRARLRETLCEAFRQGAKGPAREAILAYSDWGFDLASVTMPVHLWFGDQDGFVPMDLANRLIQGIAQPHVHWMEGAGHFNYNAWEAALRTAIEA